MEQCNKQQTQKHSKHSCKKLHNVIFEILIEAHRKAMLTVQSMSNHKVAIFAVASLF